MNFPAPSGADTGQAFAPKYRELIAKGDDLKFRKKRLEAMSKRWTEVVVHQEFQAASLFSKATASLTSAVDTS
jgi:hypothetical protein